MRTADRVWHWLADSAWRGLVLALALTAVLRLPFTGYALTGDEGGFLYVAQHWPGAGHWLYAGQWVDRPPVLICVFKLAALLGGSALDVRLVGLVVAWIAVSAAWWAGRSLIGPQGALVAALVTAAVGSNRLIGGAELNGDGIAAAFVMVSCALLFAAIRAPRRAEIPLAGLAGLFSALAFLTKQNALLGAVVAAVVLLAALPRWRLLVAYAVGAILPLAATLAWAAAGPGVATLVYAISGFRLRAAQVLWATGHSPWHLVALAVESGVVILLAQLVAVIGWHRSIRARVALVLGTAYLAVSIWLSANWLSYYLLAFVPLLALSSALAVAPRPRLALLPRSVAALAVALALAAMWLGRTSIHEPEAVTAAYLAAASHPGDSVFVSYGEPNIIEMSGLRAVYPYSWALPARVRDPDGRLLARTLGGARPPTWLVELSPFGRGPASTPRLAQVVRRRYRVAGTVCGHRIYLLRSAQRDLPSAPRCRP